MGRGITSGRFPARNGEPPAAFLHSQLAAMLAGHSYYTMRGYDDVAGEYRYTLCIVLATGEAAILDD